MVDHDSSYRDFFSTPRMVKDLLTGFIQEPWIQELDFDNMQPVKTDFIATDNSQRQSDVIWRIPWGEQQLYIYIMLEMQSTIDRDMALRTLTYICLLWQNLIKSGECTGKLPPVLPIVLYNGKRPWTAAVSLQQLMTDMPAALQAYQPQFKYFLLDEGRVATDKLAWPNLVGALVEFEQSQSLAQIQLVLERLSEWLNQDTIEHSDLRRIFLSWVRSNIIMTRFPSAELPEFNSLFEVKNMLAETMQEWVIEWQQEGLKKGLKKGLEEGLEKGSYLNKIENAKKMRAEGLSIDLIQRITGLSLQEIKNLPQDGN